MTDEINHPPHYNWFPSGVEPIDICEWLPFNPGCAAKYISRAGHKEPGAAGKIKDYQKAIWYLNREIERLEKYGEKALECK